MSDQTDTRAEIIKLARVLGQDADSLAFLESVGWEDLRAFRNLGSDQFFQAAESRLKNLAAAAKLVPNPVIIKLAPQYFEPRMAAGVASLIDEDKALKLVPKLPPNLMADTVPYIDPRRVGPLIGKIPVDIAQKLAPLMLDAKEYISFGQLLDVVTPEQFQGLLPLVDDVSLLKIAEVTENKQQFNVLFQFVDDARVGRLFQAAKDANLLDVALDFVREVDGELRTRLVGVAAQQSDAAVDALLKAVESAGEWGTILPTLDQIDPASLGRLARATALQDEGVVNSLVDAALANNLVGQVLPLVPQLSDAGLTALANARGLAEGTAVGPLVAAAVERAKVADVLPLIGRTTDSVRQSFAAEVGKLDVSAFEGVVRNVIAADSLSELLPLVPLLPKQLQERVSAIAADFDPEAMREALVDASESGVLPEMLEVAANMPLEARQQAVEIINTHADDDDLLGAALEPEEQQNIWTQVLKLTDNVPAPLVQQLSERAAFLPLDSILPSILKAGELTNEWQTSFTLLSGISDRAAKEGVPLDFTIPTQLLQTAASQASQLGDAGNALSFAKTLISQVGSDETASSAVQVTLGVLGEGVAPIKALAEGASVTEVVTDVAAKAGGLASSLFGRAKAATEAVRKTVEQPKQ